MKNEQGCEGHIITKRGTEYRVERTVDNSDGSDFDMTMDDLERSLTIYDLYAAIAKKHPQKFIPIDYDKRNPYPEGYEGQLSYEFIEVRDGPSRTKKVPVRDIVQVVPVDSVPIEQE